LPPDFNLLGLLEVNAGPRNRDQGAMDSNMFGRALFNADMLPDRECFSALRREFARQLPTICVDT
jgi:hypothetical protein